MCIMIITRLISNPPHFRLPATRTDKKAWVVGYTRRKATAAAAVGPGVRGVIEWGGDSHKN